MHTYFHPQFKCSSSSVFHSLQTHTHMSMVYVKRSLLQPNSETANAANKWKVLQMRKKKDSNRYSKQEHFHGWTSILYIVCVLCIRGLFFWFVIRIEKPWAFVWNRTTVIITFNLEWSWNWTWKSWHTFMYVIHSMAYNNFNRKIKTIIYINE